MYQKWDEGTKIFRKEGSRSFVFHQQNPSPPRAYKTNVNCSKQERGLNIGNSLFQAAGGTYDFNSNSRYDASNHTIGPNSRHDVSNYKEGDDPRYNVSKINPRSTSFHRAGSLSEYDQSQGTRLDSAHATYERKLNPPVYNNRYTRMKLQTDMLTKTDQGFLSYLKLNSHVLLKNAWEREIIPRKIQNDLLPSPQIIKEQELNILNSKNITHKSKLNNISGCSPSDTHSLGEQSKHTQIFSVTKDSLSNERNSVSPLKMNANHARKAWFERDTLQQEREEFTNICPSGNNTSPRIQSKQNSMVSNNLRAIRLSYGGEEGDSQSLINENSEKFESNVTLDNDSNSSERNIIDFNMKNRCRRYLSHGSCPKEDSCKFLHTLPKDDNIFCRNNITGICKKRASECLYKHDQTEENYEIDTCGLIHEDSSDDDDGPMPSESIGSLLSLLRKRKSIETKAQTSAEPISKDKSLPCGTNSILNANFSNSTAKSMSKINKSDICQRLLTKSNDTQNTDISTTVIYKRKDYQYCTERSVGENKASATKIKNAPVPNSSCGNVHKEISQILPEVNRPLSSVSRNPKVQTNEGLLMQQLKEQIDNSRNGFQKVNDTDIATAKKVDSKVQGNIKHAITNQDMHRNTPYTEITEEFKTRDRNNINTNSLKSKLSSKKEKVSAESNVRLPTNSASGNAVVQTSEKILTEQLMEDSDDSRNGLQNVNITQVANAIKKDKVQDKMKSGIVHQDINSKVVEKDKIKGIKTQNRHQIKKNSTQSKESLEERNNKITKDMSPPHKRTKEFLGEGNEKICLSAEKVHLVNRTNIFKVGASDFPSKALEKLSSKIINAESLSKNDTRDNPKFKNTTSKEISEENVNIKNCENIKDNKVTICNKQVTVQLDRLHDEKSTCNDTEISQNRITINCAGTSKLKEKSCHIGRKRNGECELEKSHLSKKRKLHDLFSNNDSKTITVKCKQPKPKRSNIKNNVQQSNTSIAEKKISVKNAVGRTDLPSSGASIYEKSEMEKYRVCYIKKSNGANSSLNRPSHENDDSERSNLKRKKNVHYPSKSKTIKASVGMPSEENKIYKTKDLTKAKTLKQRNNINIQEKSELKRKTEINNTIELHNTNCEETETGQTIVLNGKAPEYTNSYGKDDTGAMHMNVDVNNSDQQTAADVIRKSSKRSEGKRSNKIIDRNPSQKRKNSDTHDTNKTENNDQHFNDGKSPKRKAVDRTPSEGSEKGQNISNIHPVEKTAVKRRSSSQKNEKNSSLKQTLDEIFGDDERECTVNSNENIDPNIFYRIAADETVIKISTRHLESNSSTSTNKQQIDNKINEEPLQDNSGYSNGTKDFIKTEVTYEQDEYELPLYSNTSLEDLLEVSIHLCRLSKEKSYYKDRTNFDELSMKVCEIFKGINPPLECFTSGSNKYIIMEANVRVLLAYGISEEECQKVRQAIKYNFKSVPSLKDYMLQVQNSDE